MNKLSILTAAQIEQKLKRMAFEIWERNSDEKEITLIGIEKVGATVAKNLTKLLKEISPLKVNEFSINLDKEKLEIEGSALDAKLLKSTPIILVDDVANSGKTLLYAMRPLLDFKPRKIIIAVLVDRKHKNFPIRPDIIGHSVSTTLQEHIIVNLKDGKLTGAHLE